MWLASFTWNNVFKFHPCCGMRQYFISFYCYIVFLLSGYTTLCLSIHPLTDIGLFAVNAAMNICTQVFVWTCLHSFLISYLSVELLDHMITLCLTIWGTQDCFLKWLCHFGGGTQTNLEYIYKKNTSLWVKSSIKSCSQFSSPLSLKLSPLHSKLPW